MLGVAKYYFNAGFNISVGLRKSFSGHNIAFRPNNKTSTSVQCQLSVNFYSE